MDEALGNITQTPLSMTNLLLNLAIGLVLATVVQWHFRRFGSTLSNREEFAQVFPFILMTTILIISVVKSSLALSLGLVGALSIVRFRTPIKEPEELAYLFISIAIGLGLGASRTLETSVAAIVILGAMAFLKWRRTDSGTQNLYFSIEADQLSDVDSDKLLGDIMRTVTDSVSTADLRRVDIQSNRVEVTFFITVESTDNIQNAAAKVRELDSRVSVTFLDQSRMPTI